MSTTSGTTDISVKYQRLASEFVKLRSQVSILKSAILDEQKKSTHLQDELSEKDTAIRKFQDENEGLLFRNCQLLKRVELLQKSLDDLTKLQAAKGKKNQKEANLRLFVNLTDQPTNIPGTSTGTDRRQLFEQEFERQQQVICELECEISTIKDQHSSMINELTGKVAGLEVDNLCLKQKLKETEEIQSRRNSSKSKNTDHNKTNGIHKHELIEENPAKNGVTKEQLIDSLTQQISNDISKKDAPIISTTIQDIISNEILTEHTKRLFDEANNSKAQWEGAVSALEHELEIMRKWKEEQTKAADSVDPETKSTEKCLNSFLRDKIKQLCIDLRFAKGETAYYKDECDALLSGTKTLLENKANEVACKGCSSLKELLDDTRNTFEFQMRRLYEQLNEQETQLQDQKVQINSMAGNSSQNTRENSIKQNLRRMVGK